MTQAQKDAIYQIAYENLLRLHANVYPGRFIAMGNSEDGNSIAIIYAIMGRSDKSRNRIFVEEANGCLKTAQAVPNDEDTSLIIYNAMLEERGIFFAVSNGNQTKSAINCINKDGGLNNEMFTDVWKYEPDASNYTSRITAIYNKEDKKFQFLLLRKSMFDSNCEKQFYEYSHFNPGYGRCIHTYSGNGDPLPPFTGEPYLIPLAGNQEELLNNFWTTLEGENLVSLAVKFIDIVTGESKILIKNKYEKQDE